LALFLAGAEGFRTPRKDTAQPSTKFIAGVPVYNYHAAYNGRVSLGELEGEAEEEWILFLEPGTTDAQAEDLCKVSRNGCNFVGHPTGGVPFVEFRGTEVDLEQVIYSDLSAVAFVEPDQEDFQIPDMDGDDDDVGAQAATWGLNKIGADSRSKTGSGVTIYVQDTGIRFTHQEFGSRAKGAIDLTSGSLVECKGSSSCGRDVDGHGTHIAGTAGGKTYGVAPSAQIRAVKTLRDNGSGGPRHWQFAAIDWVTAKGARPAVISMSLRGSGQSEGYTTSIDAAVNNGVVVVVAAGNDNDDACKYSPAFATNAITVGSTTSRNARSSFSNFGSCTNIWAPGSSVVSASVRSDTRTVSRSGTSCACPHVSGAAALILSGNPSMKPSAVLRELKATARKNVLTGLKSSDVNELLYVGAGGAPPSPPSAPSPAPSPPSDGGRRRRRRRS